MSEKRNHKEYLAIRLGVLGDVILTTGVLNYWHMKRGMHFHMVTRSTLAPIFEHHPAVSQILTVHDQDLHGSAWLSFCHSLRQNFGHLPLLDLHKNLRTSFLALTWPGPKFSYAKYSLERRLFLATRHNFFSTRLKKTNVPQRYSLALENYPPHPSLLRPKIFLTPEELQLATQTLHTLGLTRPVAIHPYATHPAKSPAPKIWQQVIQLLKSQGHEVIIIGHNPKPLAPNWNQDLTNTTSLRQTAALLRHCYCLISGDSGPMHLATAINTPVIALFGPTTQEWGFYPSGPKDIVYQLACPKAPCSLHGQNNCTQTQTCMEHLTAENIVALVQTISD